MSSGSTTTVATQACNERLTVDNFPAKLQDEYIREDRLSHEQCGHLRHFYNLASQLDGEWSLMGTQEPGQEWESAYRYQLATMTYAVGAACYHHIPAMTSMLKPLMRRLIHKMLRRDVWQYWYLTSQSGIRTDPDRKELRKPWADPVIRENIMYSGHLLLMVSLYTMLFNDHEFDGPDSIVFEWDPLFWGMGSESFKYSRQTLQEAVLKEMEREKWMGACCEPNLIFIVCNQFPLIAMRYNDVVDGTNIVEPVLEKYKAAWAEKGMIGKNGLFRAFYMVGRGALIDSPRIGHHAWAMAFMPWNYDAVKTMYPSTGVGFIHRIDDRMNINAPETAQALRDIIAEEGGDPDDIELLCRARDAGSKAPPPPGLSIPYGAPVFGLVACWLSEIAGAKDLDALLNHAEKFLNPTWRDGGLYYARFDEGWDKDGNYTFVDPVTGNAAIGYARLNVLNGQKKMWDHPWTAEEVEKRPWIDGVNFDQAVDALSGKWYEEDQLLLASFRTWNGATVTIKPVVKGLSVGEYGVYIDRQLRTVTRVEKAEDDIVVELEVGGQAVEMAVVKAPVGFIMKSRTGGVL